VVCQTEFMPKRDGAQTCSHRCRQKAYRSRKRDAKIKLIVSP
jgi:hypothetical protein